MNILMISPFDLVPEQFWGPTTRLHSLAREMIAGGHSVILVGPPPFRRQMPAEYGGVPLHYFKRAFHRYFYPDDQRIFINQHINRLGKIPLITLSRTVELIKLVKIHRIDLIYLNRAFVDTAYPAAVARFVCGVPIVYDWDDLEGLHGFTTMHRRKLRYQLLETFNEVAFTRVADATVVASTHLKVFADQIGVPGDRLFYAPTVADSDKFHPNISGKDVCQRFSLEGCKVLVYCGNLMQCNGVRVENIIHTMALLLKRDPAYRLLVIGDGELLSCDGQPGVLPRLAESHGISDNIVFAGGIPYDDVPGYISAADLCLALFPVNLITMTKSPLKVYEYLAAGKPVVARDVGEISHCIQDGVNGRLVYSDDPQEYADKISSVFADDPGRAKMGIEARRTIEERYLWHHSAIEAVKACKKAVAGYSSRNGKIRQ